MALPAAFAGLGQLGGVAAKVGKFAGRSFTEFPFSTTVGAGFLAGEVGRPIAKALDPTSTGLRSDLADQRRIERLQHMQQMRAVRIQRDMMENMARLAAAAPHTYNELLAGRSLPQGAVVIGGQPRMDVLEQVALQQSLGHFGQSSPADDTFAQFVGP